MRTVRAMIGMPVICGHRRLGRLLQADLAADLKQLDGIWVSGAVLGTRYIPAERLEMIGEVAVMADGPGARRRLSVRPLFRRAVSTDGRRLGAITGAEIDELSFAVTALELSAGLWDDLFNRRSRVLRYTVNRATGEVIVDPAGQDKEADTYAGRHDERPARRNADRRIGGHDLRRDELEDAEAVEPEGEADHRLDPRQGG